MFRELCLRKAKRTISTSAGRPQRKYLSQDSFISDGAPCVMAWTRRSLRHEPLRFHELIIPLLATHGANAEDCTRLLSSCETATSDTGQALQARIKLSRLRF